MGKAQKLKQQRKEEEARREEQKRKETYRKVVVIVASLAAIGVTVGLILLVNAMKKSEDTTGPTATREMVLETTKGEIVIELYGEQAPLTVDHVTNLVERGFYDGLLWYRVEDFVVQTGSHVQSLLAQQEEGVQPDETLLQEAQLEDSQVMSVTDEIGESNLRGAVGMAKPSDPETQLPQPNSATTDFYILKEDQPGLDAYFTVFGRVIQGMEVVDSLTDIDQLIKAQIREK